MRRVTSRSSATGRVTRNCTRRVKDLDELSERSPSATSPSSKNEDMELAEPKESSDDGDQGIKSVVGADGLREFVMLPEWTVNNFRSTIKEVHFKTLKIGRAHV